MKKPRKGRSRGAARSGGPGKARPGDRAKQARNGSANLGREGNAAQLASGDRPKGSDGAAAGNRPQPQLGAGREDLAAAAPPFERHGQIAGRGRGRGRMPITVLLPGRAFVTMGRPIAGLVCYALQASLVGWLPAVLWAVRAQGRVERKQRVLAARLRPI